ncbi:MAG: apolipoprotein N-acyltransferase [Beggiatoa sp. IS2]|nr:MAG: apolipoprotein N-acyltransferase [Beggiatoa sp. IS2]
MTILAPFVNLSNRSPRYLGDGLALGTGASLPLAFAPFALFPIAWLSPAILFLLWRDQTPVRACWRGLLFGIGLFAVGISWINNSFYYFGGIPLPGSILLTLGFICSMALYPALLGWLLTRGFPKTNAVKLFLIIPASWVLMEWLRGWLFTGFPWLTLGYSQIDSPLRGFAPLLGVYGVSWVTVLIASALAYIFHYKRHFLPISLLIMTFASSGWLLSKITWHHAVDKPLAVALVQGNIPQEYKWATGFQISSIQRYLYLSQAHRDANLIIWPETAIPLFHHQIIGFLESLQAEHTKNGTDFLIGIPVMNPAKTAYFNGIMSISENPGFYFKRHLVPFGEYIPLQSILGKLLKLLEVPLSDFTAGAADQPNLRVANQAIGLSVCYEDVFGELLRTSLPEATLLVNVSNDAWFSDTLAPYQHLEIARMRALESGRFLLRATNTGISAVIDASGRIVAQATPSKVYVLRAQVQPYQGTTPYIYFGNALVIILSFLCVLLGIYLKRRN